MVHQFDRNDEENESILITQPMEPIHDPINAIHGAEYNSAFTINITVNNTYNNVHIIADMFYDDLRLSYDDIIAHITTSISVQGSQYVIQYPTNESFNITPYPILSHHGFNKIFIYTLFNNSYLNTINGASKVHFIFTVARDSLIHDLVGSDTFGIYCHDNKYNNANIIAASRDRDPPNDDATTQLSNNTETFAPNIFCDSYVMANTTTTNPSNPNISQIQLLQLDNETVYFNVVGWILNSMRYSIHFMCHKYNLIYRNMFYYLDKMILLWLFIMLLCQQLLNDEISVQGLYFISLRTNNTINANNNARARSIDDEYDVKNESNRIVQYNKSISQLQSIFNESNTSPHIQSHHTLLLMMGYYFILFLFGICILTTTINATNASNDELLPTNTIDVYQPHQSLPHGIIITSIPSVFDDHGLALPFGVFDIHSSNDNKVLAHDEDILPLFHYHMHNQPFILISHSVIHTSHIHNHVHQYNLYTYNTNNMSISYASSIDDKDSNDVACLVMILRHQIVMLIHLMLITSHHHFYIFYKSHAGTSGSNKTIMSNTTRGEAIIFQYFLFQVIHGLLQLHHALHYLLHCIIRSLASSGVPDHSLYKYQASSADTINGFSTVACGVLFLTVHHQYHQVLYCYYQQWLHYVDLELLYTKPLSLISFASSAIIIFVFQRIIAALYRFYLAGLLNTKCHFSTSILCIIRCLFYIKWFISCSDTICINCTICTPFISLPHGLPIFWISCCYYNVSYIMLYWANIKCYSARICIWYHMEYRISVHYHFWNIKHFIRCNHIIHIICIALPTAHSQLVLFRYYCQHIYIIWCHFNVIYAIYVINSTRYYSLIICTIHITICYINIKYNCNIWICCDFTTCTAILSFIVFAPSYRLPDAILIVLSASLAAAMLISTTAATHGVDATSRDINHTPRSFILNIMYIATLPCALLLLHFTFTLCAYQRVYGLPGVLTLFRRHLAGAILLFYANIFCIIWITRCYFICITCTRYITSTSITLAAAILIGVSAPSAPFTATLATSSTTFKQSHILSGILAGATSMVSIKFGLPGTYYYYQHWVLYFYNPTII